MERDTYIYWLKQGTEEWKRAWKSCCPNGKVNEGEGWQYMGTVQNEEGYYKHQFRNRCINGQREYRHVAAVQFPNICPEVYEPKTVYTAVCTKMSDGRIDCDLWSHKEGQHFNTGELCDGATLDTENQAVSNACSRYGIMRVGVLVHRINYKGGEDAIGYCRQCEATIDKKELTHGLCVNCRQHNHYDARRRFNESEIGGVVDCMGNVSSDADSGL
jgi:hypothetical protein